nr:putative late blight resistance protein homolog R1C-3 isoform X3 [Ipomoea trifida]
MTAFALITSLLNTLHFHFQQPVPCLILDDTEVVESLCKKIRFLQAFLEDSHINSEARSGLETEIRGVAHDAEAKIESELHLFYLQCNQVDLPVKPPQSLYHTLQQVTREIESIEERIQIESNNNQSVESSVGVGSTIEGDTSNDDPPAIDLTDLPAININERVISNDPPATRLRSTLILDIIPGEIVDLVNLRYLALSTNVVLHKFQWFKLRSLQTFIVDFHGYSWKAEPPHILDMPRLRNVYFTKGSPLYLPKLVQENLLTISWLNVPEPLWTKSDLTKIPNVKKLGIYIGISMNFMPSLLPPGSLDGLADLHQLENLKIAAKESNLLVGDFQLPKVFPPNLKKLTLCHTYLPWDDMLLIATLPNLEILKLIGYAFYGSEWKTTENGFCRLKYFQIEESNLKYWSAVANHFPTLEYLILSYCQHLEEVPADFVDITTLQLIKLTHCCSSLVTSAKHIQKERLDYGDYKLVVRDFHTLPQR